MSLTDDELNRALRTHGELLLLREIALVAREMRASQKQYFLKRTQTALRESMRLEKHLDRLLEEPAIHHLVQRNSQ